MCIIYLKQRAVQIAFKATVGWETHLAMQRAFFAALNHFFGLNLIFSKTTSFLKALMHSLTAGIPFETNSTALIAT